MDDWKLLQQYVEQRSEEAFAELLNRHLGVVYSIALRRLGGDIALAQDVAQKAFCLLAQKARSLRPSGPLVGWLARTTVNLARDAARGEERRRSREQEAALMQTLEQPSSSESVWQETAPLLDEAIDRLPEAERLAILLRFFQQKSFREVGAAFNSS